MTAQPFSQSWETPFAIPPFDRMETADFRPAFDAAIETHRAEIEALVTNPDEPDFANTIEALELAGQGLIKVSRVFYNLTGTLSDEPLRAVVYRMAENGLTRMPVVERGNVTSLLGILTLEDLLRARTRHLEEDRDRSRVLHIPFLGTRPDPEDRHEDHDSLEDKITNTRK